MLYPNILTNISDNLSLYLPDPAKVKTVYEKLLATDPQTAFPFWAKTWPSAYVLTDFLQEEPQWVTGKKVLELGAGTALPSFTIAHLSKDMIISDHAPEAVQLMKKNIHQLGLDHVKAMQLDWNDFPENITADVLLLSDINYASDQFNVLIDLIKRFLNADATIILSTPTRINITPFAEALQSSIKRSILRIDNHEQTPVEIRILILSNQPLA